MSITKITLTEQDNAHEQFRAAFEAINLPNDADPRLLINLCDFSRTIRPYEDTLRSADQSVNNELAQCEDDIVYVRIYFNDQLYVTVGAGSDFQGSAALDDNVHPSGRTRTDLAVNAAIAACEAFKEYCRSCGITRHAAPVIAVVSDGLPTKSRDASNPYAASRRFTDDEQAELIRRCHDYAGQTSEHARVVTMFLGNETDAGAQFLEALATADHNGIKVSKADPMTFDNYVAFVSGTIDLASGLKHNPGPTSTSSPDPDIPSGVPTCDDNPPVAVSADYDDTVFDPDALAALDNIDVGSVTTFND